MTRMRRLAQSNPEEYEKAWGEYRSARDALRAAIGSAKSEAWKELFSQLDRDPWGRPYRLVLNKLKGGSSPITKTLDPHFVNQIIDTLFPRRDQDVDPIPRREQAWNEREMGVTEGELLNAVRKIKRGKAPGPDGIHGRIWKMDLAGHMRQLYNDCFREGRFPQEWKVAHIVLLPKGGRPGNIPLAFRFACWTRREKFWNE